jgi:hypothetical protein
VAEESDPRLRGETFATGEDLKTDDIMVEFYYLGKGCFPVDVLDDRKVAKGHVLRPHPNRISHDLEYPCMADEFLGHASLDLVSQFIKRELLSTLILYSSTAP